MKNCKKILSVILSVLMLITILPMSLFEVLATTTVTSANSPSCTFYVPETIYLNPSDGTTFQYYVDRDSSGNLVASANDTTGNIYFNCSSASAVTSLTCNGATVSLSSTSSSSGTLSANITSGSISSALSSGSTSQISWTLTYTVNGKNYIAKAYSTLYSPNRNVTACGVFGYDYNSSESCASSLIYIYGAHKTYDGARTVQDACCSADVINYQNVSTSSKYLDPLVNGVANPDSDGNAPNSWTTSDSPFTNATKSFTACRCAKENKYDGNGDWVMQVDYNTSSAELYVDSSRYTNTNQLPNLGLGFIVTDWDNSNSRRNYYVSDATSAVTYDSDGTPHLYSSSNSIDITHHYYCKDDDKSKDIYGSAYGTVLSGTTSSGDQVTGTNIDGSTNDEGQKYKAAISCDITANSTSTQTRFYRGACTGNKNKSWAMSSAMVSMKVICVNKSALRTNVNTCIGTYNHLFYTAASYGEYSKALAAAALVLGNPAATATEITNANNALNTAKNALVRITGTATETITFTNDKATQTSTKTYNAGDTVSTSDPSVTGYKKSSFTSKTNLISIEDFYNFKNGTTYVNRTGNTITSVTLSNGALSVTGSGNDNYTTMPPMNGVTYCLDTHYCVPVTPGKTYTLSYTATGTSAQGFIFPVDENGISLNACTSSYATGNTSCSYTVPSNVRYVAFRFGNGTANSTTVFTNISFTENGATTNATSYALAQGDTLFNYTYTPITYTVTYSGNGNTGGSTASSTHTYDAAKTLTSNGFEKKYTVTFNANGGSCSTSSLLSTSTFAGWKDSSNNSYTNGQSVTNLTSTDGATIAMTAQWTDNAISFPTASKTYDSTNHYGFLGWYDAASGGTKIGGAGTSYTPTANKTLYAQYSTTAHNLSSIDTVSATCTTTGTRVWSCSGCSYSYTETVPVLGHSWDNGAITKSATCTAEGEKTFTCTRSGCGETKKESVAKLAHNPKAIIATAATCTTAGNNLYYKCNDCGNYFSDAACTQSTTVAAQTIAALGHDYSKQDQSKLESSATCTSKAKYYYTCSRCNAQGTETYEYGSTAPHTTVKTAAKAATCLAAGNNEYYTCSVCLGVFKDVDCTQSTTAAAEVVAKLEHSYTGAAQSNANGTHSQMCVNGCGQRGNPVACTFGEWSQAVAPSCTVAGQRQRNCTICNYRDTESIASLGHTYVYTAGVPATCETGGSSAYYTCSVCNRYFDTSYNEIAANSWILSALGHSWDEGTWNWSDDGQSATITFTCQNDNSHIQQINATVTGVVKTAADCTNKGVTTYTASVSFGGKNYTDTKDVEDIAALGHDDGTRVVITKATCTTDGSYNMVCGRCSAVFSTGTIAKRNHDWDVWKITTAATCYAEGAKQRSCKNTEATEDYEACSCIDYATIEKTAHTPDNAVQENIVDPTCTVGGSYDEVVYCSIAACKAEISRTKKTVNALGHSFTSYTSNNNATCTKNCTETATCDRCDVQNTRDIENSALGHQISATPAVEPTCTKAGNYAYYTCGRCNKIYSDTNYTIETTVAAQTRNALGHAEINHEAKAATCTEGGWKAYVTCSRCDYTTYEVVEALGHDYGSATCTDVATCSRCGYSTGVPIGHNYEYTFTWNGTSACSCTRVCSRGDSTETKTCAITSATVAATCENDGKTTYTATASFSDATKTNDKIVVIPATGHNYSGSGHNVSEGNHNFACVNGCGTYGVNGVKNATVSCTYGDNPVFTWTGFTATAKFTCTACSGTHTETATITNKITTPATCTETGIRTYTATVGFNGSAYTSTKTDSVAIDLNNHALENISGKVPTCEEVGWDAYQRCTREGCSYSTYNEIPALGHDYSGKIHNVEDGKHNYACTKGCGTYGVGTTKNATVDCVYTTAPVFTWTGYTACTATFVCADCKDVNVADCVITDTNLDAPSCLEGGTVRHTASIEMLGKTYSEYKDEVVDVLGHSFTNYVSNGDATCLEDGTETAKCDRCEVTDTRTEVGSALGHDEIPHEALAATCLTDGYKAYVTCSRCDYTTFETIKALGHIITKYTEKPSTCTATGWKAYEVCSREGCGYTTFEETAPTGHINVSYHETIAATCKINGCSEYWYCEDCGGYFANATCTTSTTATALIIDKSTVAHTPGDARKENAVEKTCSVNGGYDMVTRCTVCNAVTSTEHIVVPSTGHFGGVATCQSKAVCDSCGQEYGGYGSHKYGYKTVAATCVSEGYTLATCIYCNHSEVTNVTSATAHKWDNGVVTKAATSTATGEITYTCLVCGGNKYESIPMVECNHIDEDGDNKCDICGTFIGSVIIDDDDEETESEFRCSMCDKAEQEPDNAFIQFIHKIIHALSKFFSRL